MVWVNSAVLRFKLFITCSSGCLVLYSINSIYKTANKYNVVRTTPGKPNPIVGRHPDVNVEDVELGELIDDDMLKDAVGRIEDQEPAYCVPDVPSKTVELPKLRG